ncbi:MAG: glucose-1-phosphate adenylyltransferase [Chloroflexi bacterium HGW-Chloroflexi-5]|jgi:glucose-1-phosphate adenylyltransferase|nr:MAG: glucose-1-phosphate adenylyltransferase [Chloroflexi bacterium HGW-Chloroflexi-5]
MANVDDILAVILGGGRGSRLFPLTQQRSKPAVPMAGKYRLIDIPISNCINSGILRIGVLTQFNSISLHRHIVRTYNFDAFHQGWVQIWAAEQTMGNNAWYQGTADAVRKQLPEIRSSRAKYVLILAGDHLYRMDFAKMADFHVSQNADITVAVQPVSKEDAPRFGILKRDSANKITDFFEKPKDPKTLEYAMSRDDPEKPYLGSMGIYLFKTDVLIDLLETNTDDDFGGEVIPSAINTHSVYGYDFEGFWEDIGTIRTFYDTNLALAMQNPPFNFFDPSNPIYSHPRFLPGSVITSCVMENTMLSEGCRIENATIKHSVIGLRSQICSGVKIKDCILMGNDYYERDWAAEGKKLPLHIGDNCSIEGAIIDKNARLGEGVIIRPFPLGTEMDGAQWVVRDGIVVIPKNSQILPGTVIAPE